jgi:1-deoxy-D-xylulose-5-phosphate reductoisomerase
LTFAKPDFSEFPCLAYALEAAAAGGTAPAILNAANESAVEAFCRGRIPFLRISEIVREVLDECPSAGDVSLESVAAADRVARECARQIMRPAGV